MVLVARGGDSKVLRQIRALADKPRGASTLDPSTTRVCVGRLLVKFACAGLVHVL